MERLSLVNALKSANPLRYLRERDLLFIIEHGQLLSFADEAIILHQGKKGQGLYILVEGRMQVSIKLLGKGTIHLATLSPGNFFGEVSFLENQPCTATISSQGNSSCFLFKRETFDQLYLAFPEIRYHISRALIEDVITRQGLMADAIKKYADNFEQEKINLNIYKKDDHSLTDEPITREDLDNFFKRLPMGDLPLLYPNPWIKNKIQFPNNHIIIRQKEREQSCFYILKGAVQVGLVTASGFVKFAVIGPRSLICPASILNNHDERFVYKSIGKTTVLEIVSKDIERLKQNYPQAWYHFYDALVGHVISLQKKLNAQILLIESLQLEKRDHV